MPVQNTLKLQREACHMFMDEEEIVGPDLGGWWGCWMEVDDMGRAMGHMSRFQSLQGLILTLFIIIVSNPFIPFQSLHSSYFYPTALHQPYPLRRHPCQATIPA